ncbi:uncharacterized protein PHACADRAFT_247955 [Phanerochaete carnosa HHB-10118-sp]|uniref:Uncharacterized protein n=1 Tax=Phanerochaete carnosa (strain HHB-10118-sp) TaxID=650164 RepID=K5VEH2_PHACS|nr:uncharacterized protein PHACADRAFT_247955 [Phanerochaete carnosa HHB-10118-sp]EKM61391.1 hypothetical protein PHACADRAFT_247955 [Phanerochaete carnosa HHB-10118-sp]
MRPTSLGLAATALLSLVGVPVSFAFPISTSTVSSRAVPPAGSGLFNPGTLSHPLVPITDVVSGVAQDETGTKMKSV